MNSKRANTSLNTLSNPIRGSLVALVTPMHPDGSIDWDAFSGLIEWHIQEGTDALVIMGSTGETATVSHEEHRDLIRIAIVAAKGRIPIIAGTGANSTSEAMELALYAKRAGATAHLSVVPYYNKPTQSGMIAHFTKIAETVDLPLILYNVPSRTIADMSHETVLRLSKLPNVIGLKDATGDIARGVMLMRELPESFAVYSGDDETAAALILLGASGNISVTANVAPRLMKQLCQAALAGEVEKVKQLNARLAPLSRSMFLESNPIPVKWALARLRKIHLSYRLPLTPLESQYHNEVMAAMHLASIEAAA